MKRRNFVAGAAAAALLPAFLEKAFACPPAVDRTKCKDVPVGADDTGIAWQAAVKSGKPLLVIVVPQDDGKKYNRGELWGEVLNHGPTSTWAALGCVEVVCAPVAALQHIVPVAATDDDLFVLVDTGAVPARAAAHTVAVPDHDRGWGRGGDDTWEGRQRKENALSDQRIALVGGLVEAAVFGKDRALLATRVAQTEAARKLAPSAGDDDNASVLVQRGELARVQAAAEARLKMTRIRGSKWARGAGCGVDVEGDDTNVGIACGMGHTPEKASRFLYWFTRE